MKTGQCTVGDDVESVEYVFSGQPCCALLYKPYTLSSNLYMSDLDFWLNSTPF